MMNSLPLIKIIQTPQFPADMGTAILFVSILIVFVLIILNYARLMKRSAVEHEQTVQALYEATERELAVIRNALDVICTIDAQGNFASMNPACFRMWGYQPAELIGRSYVELVVPEDVAKTIESTASNMSGEELTDFENRYRHKDGTIVNLMWTSHWSESEQLMFAVAHDITERKRAEEELKDFAARLERSNSELQDFASVAAHDLQEPLRKVQAFGDRLKAKCGDALNEAGLDYLERMQKAAGRMQVLIEDLMTFSRVTTQAQPFVPVDLQLVAEEVLSDLEMRIETSNGRVEISQLATIDADPTQMRQLLQNLISNALKFNRPGIPPVVKVGGQFLENNSGNANEKSNGAIYRLTVEDNGIGFESKYVDRIFKVFQRLHGRTEYEGTGIGLAVCRKITERHGGDITVKSVPGEGTIFIADLPIKQLGEKLNNE
jgi:two-component system sensor kinase FixL